MRLQDATTPEPATIPQERPRDEATIALLEDWLEEAARLTPQEAAEAERELEDLLQNLNRNRIEAGERPLLP